MSQWNYLKLEIGLLDSLLWQRNSFEAFNILIFSKILLKFTIVFKVFWIFLSFSSLAIITGQWSFSNLADGLLDITPEIKSSFEPFHCEIWKHFF